MEKKIKEVEADIIVDLYEMRARTVTPFKTGVIEKIENFFQYNFFELAISILCDKYKISSRDIEESIRRRAAIEELKTGLNNELEKSIIN